MEKTRIELGKHLFIRIWAFFTVFALIGGVMEGASGEQMQAVLIFAIIVGAIGGAIEAVFFNKTQENDEPENQL